MISTGPSVLTINVTSSCDAACRYCHWWRVKRQPTPEPLLELLSVVDEAAAAGVRAIRLSGGEPLLRPDLPDLVAHIRDHGMVSMVCTSAKCGRRSLDALAEVGLDLFSVSLDTVDPQAFRLIRGYDIDPVLDNVRALASRRSSVGFEIVLSVVLSRPSLEGLPDLLDFARALDLVVSFTPFQGEDPDHKSSMTGLCFRPEDEQGLRQALDLVMEAAVTRGLRVVNGDVYLRGIADFVGTRRLPTGHVCRAGASAAIRMVGGELKLCHSLPGVVAGGLVAAWSSDAARRLRARMAQLGCDGCWLSCHADERRSVPHRFGHPRIWEAL